MIDKFVKFLERNIPRLFHFLQKIAFVAIFLGFLGYFINSIKDIDLPNFSLSPISNKTLDKVAPPVQK